MINRFFKQTFNLGPYSTASKILEAVRRKVFSQPCVKKKFGVGPRIDVGGRSVDIYRQKEAVRILGKILEGKLSNSVYKEYQKLNREEKEKIRQQIADTYFNFLFISSNKLENIKVRSDVGERDMYGSRDVFISIDLPSEVFDEAKLSQALSSSLAAINDQLKTPEILQISKIRTIL